MAIPHASTPGCKQLLLAIGISREGVPWGDTERKANLIVLFLAPPDMHSAYLRALSRIARLCQAEAFIRTVLQAATPEELLRAFRSAETPLGDIVAAEGMPAFCVLGAGNGGLAMAGHLALVGCTVNLFNRNPERLLPVKSREGIDVHGEVEGFAALNKVTSDPGEAVADADVLMVVTPATAHRIIAELIAPHVKDGQIIVLNPGRTGGALEVSRILRETNPTVRPFVAETQTLLYAARITNPAQVRIARIKNSVPLATLPSYQVADVLPVIRRALPQFVPGDSVLKTGLDNIGAVFHPAITILNAARIEDTHGDFDYYIEGVTPSVANVLEAIDTERVNVAAALGIRANTAREWLYLAYDATGKTLLSAMRSNSGYFGIKAPATLDHRYISEDVPMSLVPIASIGAMLGVPTPAINAIIQLAGVMHGVDYWAEGRNVERLGIAGMTVKDIRFLVVGAEQTPRPPVLAASAEPDDMTRLPAPPEFPQGED